MKRIVGLLCVLLCGFISSVKGDALTTTTQTDREIPDPVTDLRLLQQNARSVMFSWKAPQHWAIFEICIYPTPRGRTPCQVTSGEEVTIRELDPVATFTIWVTAVRLDENNRIAARGTSQTISAQTICEKSSNVQDLTLSGSNATSVTLRWTAPSSVCGNLTGYEIHMWQTPHARRSMQVMATSFRSVLTVDKLEPNTAYTFSVSAISREPSGTLLNGTAAIVEATTNPGPVTNLTIQQQNSRSVKFSWKAPKNSALFEICIYVTRLDRKCQVTSGEENTIRELDPEATYTIWVTAVRLDRWSNIAASGSSQTITARTICEKSSIVQDLTPSGFSSTSVTLRWIAPTSVCGNLVRYEVHTWQTANGSRIMQVTPTSLQSVLTVDKLEQNTAYTFSVGAISQEPSGTLLNGASVTVEATTKPGPVTNLTIQQQNSRSLQFCWKAPKNSALFEICIYPTPRGRNQCQVTSGEENTISKLNPQATYNIQVTAVRLDENNRIAARGTSQTISAQTICETSAPLKLLPSLFTGSSSYIVLSWTAPSTVCGTLVSISVTFFKRTAINEGKSEERQYFYSPANTRANITLLTANTIYNFTAYAHTIEPSGRDSSGAADSVALRTAPASVKDLKKMRVTNDSFEAQWTAPHDVQDNELRYDLYLHLRSGFFARTLKKTTSNTTFTFDKLEPTSIYRLEVTTSNLISTEPRFYSDTSCIDILTDCSSPLGLTLQSPKQIDSSSAIVVWEPPTRWNGPPGGYIIALVTDNGTFPPCIKNANDTEHNFVHLQPSTYYEVQLIAFNNLMNSSVKLLNFTTPHLRDEGRSFWISKEGGLSWAISATVAAVASVSVNIVLFACLYRLQSTRWRKERLYKTDICKSDAQVTSTVKSVTHTGAPAETKNTFADLPCGATAKAEAPYASLQRATDETEAPYASLQRATAEIEEPYASLQQSQRTSTV